ncbi:MAG: site-specific integrase, partial [Leptolyngbyaceae bacterium]|nr:site-specific integrase [Leptolyngbyaceae bacterium]
MSLNLPATATGLKQAEQEAKVIAGKLIQNTFDWRDYRVLPGGGRLDQADLSAKLEAFEQHFFSQPQRSQHPASAKTTWETAYAPYFRKLVAISTASPTLKLPEAVYATVRSTREHSRSRQSCCTALSSLAEFLNLE